MQAQGRIAFDFRGQVIKGDLAVTQAGVQAGTGFFEDRQRPNSKNSVLLLAIKRAFAVLAEVWFHVGVCVTESHVLNYRQDYRIDLGELTNHMLFLIGMVIVFGSVLFGFVMSHGQLLALWQPFEVLIIVGAALGSFLLSNPWAVVKRCARQLPSVIFGAHHHKTRQMELLSLIYDILGKSRREGLMAIEAEVDNPQASAIFARYASVQKNPELANFVADYFRIIIVGNLSAYELEGLMDQEIDTRLNELEQPGVALGKVADALPGFGIVAAVLGIVITMGAIGGDVAEIGAHVAAALVGTFSGVLLSYGLVGPVSANLKHLAEDEIKLYDAAKAAIIASLHGIAPQLAVEFGRKALYSHSRPTFNELESRLRGR